MGKEKKRGFVRSYCDGFLNLFSYINLYNGENSLGDKIMLKTMYKPGSVDKPYMFALGFASEFALELAVPIYAASTTDLTFYHVLLLDLGIKTIP